MTAEARPAKEELEAKAQQALTDLGDDVQLPEDVAIVLAALTAAVREARRDALRDHGSRQERCVCPGCPVMVSCCWEAGMCLSCATEDCEHDLEEPTK